MTNQKTQKYTSVQQLESEIQSLKQALELKNAQLKEKTEQLELVQEKIAIAKVASKAAHDLKTPLQFIKFSTDSSFARVEEIAKEIEKQTEKLPPESIERIKNPIERLKEYLRRNLINFERIMEIVEELSVQNRRKDFQLTRIDLNSLIDSISKDVTAAKQYQAQSFCLVLETIYDPAIGEKKIVTKELNKVVSNLISNACDAVLARKKNEEEFEAKILVITKAVNPQLIELIVADNGEGISSEITDFIYQPFQTTKQGQGRGLGLYITDEVLKNNGGQIRWERKDGLTQFIVLFPVQESGQENATI